MEHVTDDCTCEGKKCTKCTFLLCVGKFTKDNRLKSKLKSQCRDCQGAANKEWRQNNREYDQVRHKVWNEANTQKINETRRHRYRRKHEYIREQRKHYRQNNYERIREQEKIYESGNLERRRIQRRREHVRFQDSIRFKAYYAERREQMSKRVMEYFHAHPGYRGVIESNRRARKREAGGAYTFQEWKTLKARYDYTCLRCGRKEPEVQLHADHIIPVIKGGSSYIDNIQPLCKSCNSSKGKKVIDFRPETP